MKKIITKSSNDEVLIRAGWFVGLKELADRYLKDASLANRAMLLGYIASTEYIINILVTKKETARKINRQLKTK